MPTKRQGELIERGVANLAALSSIEDVIADARNGKMVILVDDEDRENEGDLYIPAQMATPEAINFMAKHGRGLICLSLTRQRCDALGLELLSRRDFPQGRYTLIFLAAPGDSAAQVELTHNWDPEAYSGGRNFGHLAYQVDDIYAACRRLQEHGVTINRPPRDGRMAFVRSPDGISVELLQAGAAKAPEEPWASMPNTGAW